MLKVRDLDAVELRRLLQDAIARCRFCRPGQRCAACQVTLARLEGPPKPPRLPSPIAPSMTRR